MLRLALFLLSALLLIGSVAADMTVTHHLHKRDNFNPGGTATRYW